jgi:hypothetical protein
LALHCLSRRDNLAPVTAAESHPDRRYCLIQIAAQYSRRIEELPVATHAQSNWAVHPKGSKGEKAVIAQAVDLVREQHRYIAGN